MECNGKKRDDGKNEEHTRKLLGFVVCIGLVFIEWGHHGENEALFCLEAQWCCV